MTDRWTVTSPLEKRIRRLERVILLVLDRQQNGSGTPVDFEEMRELLEQMRDGAEARR